MFTPVYTQLQEELRKDSDVGDMYNAKIQNKGWSVMA